MNEQELFAKAIAHYQETFQRAGITPRENTILAYQRKQPPVLPCIFTDIGMVTSAFERFEGPGVGKDAFGVEWVYVPDARAPMPVPGKTMLKDIADWKEFVKFPDVEAMDWETMADMDMHGDLMGTIAAGKFVRLPEGQDILTGGKFGLYMFLNGFFERLHSLMGFEGALVSLVEDPENTYDFFSAMADYKISVLKKVKQYYKMDAIEFHDDYSCNRGMFMSLETFREVIKPNLKRVVDACHELGFLYEHHSCGKVEDLIPELIDIGADCISPLQYNCNRNVRELKDKYGDKICFAGGVNNVDIIDQPDSTPEDCIKEYMRNITEMAPGGGFVAMPLSLRNGDYAGVFALQHMMAGCSFYYDQNDK